MKHETIWKAVDNLAKKNNMSTSGLAKTIGLDPTTFNKSKRFRKDGKKRWPSLNSINKLLNYFNISFDELYGNLLQNHFHGIAISKFSTLKLESIPLDTTQHNSSQELGLETFENISFAIILDTSKYEPIFKYNSNIILKDAKELRRNDRIFTITKDKKLELYEFSADKGTHYELINLSENQKIVDIAVDDILLIKRIVWASQ